MCRLRFVRAALLAALVVGWLPAAASAQDFGLAESAETIDKGVLKLRANPMFLFGKEGQGDEAGLAVKLGYGATDRLDIEGGVAFYDNFSFVGADVEYWLVQDRVGRNALDVSVIAGFHLGNGDRTPDTRGFDLTFLASKRVEERVDLYAGLDFAFESLRGVGTDHSYTPIHLVPGVEYRLTRDIDLIGEIGLGLNDEARHYFTAGLAFYFR
jgi:hypothetical protein